MRHLLTKLKLAFPFLHERAATEEDFFNFCLEHDIGIVFTDLITAGIYVIYEGKHFVFLNDKLKGWMLRYVMFHELAHYLFHFPSQSRFGVEFFTVHSKEKNHSEAETAAAFLLLPVCEFENALQDSDFAVCDEVKELMALRLQIAKDHRI